LPSIDDTALAAIAPLIFTPPPLARFSFARWLAPLLTPSSKYSEQVNSLSVTATCEPAALPPQYLLRFAVVVVLVVLVLVRRWLSL
jgi:hypothetical protein